MERPPPERAALARIAATIRAEVAAVGRVVAALGETLARHPEPDPEVAIVHGTAGLIHDFYTGIEKALCAVTPALNGMELGRDSWHRDLLRAATFELVGIRPPLLTEATAERLSEFLAFRHLYRHLYAFSLRWERVRQLASTVDSLWPAVRADLERFLEIIDTTADSLA